MTRRFRIISKRSGARLPGQKSKDTKFFPSNTFKDKPKMNRIKLHNLEESSIFWTSSLRLTENDVAELYRILTSWFDLTRTDIGRKAMQIDCINIFEEDLKFCHRLRKLLSEELSNIARSKQNLPKIHREAFERKRERFMSQEREILTEIEQNPFISTSRNSEKDEQNA
jgi:hypothetical protein